MPEKDFNFFKPENTKYPITGYEPIIPEEGKSFELREIRLAEPTYYNSSSLVVGLENISSIDSLSEKYSSFNFKNKSETNTQLPGM